MRRACRCIVLTGRPPAGAARRRRRPDDRPAASSSAPPPSGSSRSARTRTPPSASAGSAQLACRAVWTALERPARASCTSTSRCASRSCCDAPLPPSDATRADAPPAVGAPRRAAPGDPSGLHAALAGFARAARRGRPPASARRARGARRRPACPVLADPLSGARRGPDAIAHYDALLRDAGSPRR